ncbi:MAG TPA: hypothetical protein VGX96_11980 [Candidatus Elarobacter sp.]|jgi:hypothetical protein|nr:hypothetical protein [Candidatus Elarobacter sp.]
MLNAWNSFYVVMGSSAAALTGLVFVVVTLINDVRRGTSDVGLSTFTTPTVVHFSCVLFTSAVMSAPFPSLTPIAVILGLVGAGGFLYVVRIAIRTSKLTSYRADMEDWTCNVVLPFVAYGTLIGSAIAIPAAAAQALYAPAAAVTLLVFIGIHNAWDVVTFLATGKAEQLPDEPATNGNEPQKSDAPMKGD